MKRFNKALVAGAAAVAVSFAGVSAAGAAEDPKPAPALSSFGGGKTDDAADGKKEGLKPGEIKDWISVATAIIGLFSTVFAFLAKHFNIKF